MRNINGALLMLALLLPAGRASAVSSAAGTSGAQFLKLGSGARAGAMGDAFTAIADDAFSAYYNPAGLARLQRPQLAGAHSALFQGVSYQSLAVVIPFGRGEGRERIETEGNKHAIGLSIYYLGVGDIERRTGDSTLPVGTFNSADSAYALSYSYAPSDRLSLGFTGKYIHESIDSYSGSAMAADVGVLYRVNPHTEKPITLGGSIRNIGNRIGYVSSETDPLPTTVVVAAAAALTKGITLDLDLGKSRDSNLYAALGAEGRHSLTEGITGSIRGGFNSSRRDNGGLAGLSAGGGLSFQKAAFDFAWIPFGALGDAFRFSLLVKF
ncbi:MAG: PorV/PorQ family protein [Elusimicrobia bacterium]|nr:PorV/PorQ family protein [Elusimicrobiota bacterium]